MMEQPQPRDENGNLIVRNARITHYLGSADGTHRYVLEVPGTEWHQTGPYEMRKMR